MQVAYNDAFRQLLREPRWCSASRLFVYNNVPSFDAVVCKIVFSFWCSFCKSDNMQIQLSYPVIFFISHLVFKGGVALNFHRYISIVYICLCFYMCSAVSLVRVSWAFEPAIEKIKKK